MTERPLQRERYLGVVEALAGPGQEHQGVPSGGSRGTHPQQLARIFEEPRHPVEEVHGLPDPPLHEGRHRAAVDDPGGAGRVSQRLEELERLVRVLPRELPPAQVHVHDAPHRERLGTGRGVVARLRERKLHEIGGATVVVRTSLQHRHPGQQAGAAHPVLRRDERSAEILPCAG